MAKFTSRKLAYNGSEEFKGCLRVREDGVCCTTEDDTEGPVGGGAISEVSSSTSAVSLEMPNKKEILFLIPYLSSIKPS
jgi:hypothetical protein